MSPEHVTSLLIPLGAVQLFFIGHGQTNLVSHLLQRAILGERGHRRHLDCAIKPFVKDVVVELFILLFSLAGDLLGFLNGFAHFHALKILG